MNYSGQTKSINSTDTYKLYIVDTVSGGAYTQVYLDADGLILEYPITENKFEALRPCALNIKLLSVSSSQFISFYTSNIYQWRVTLFKNATLIFEGYLNSQNFSEPYNYNNNYGVSFIAHCGFPILNRVKFSLTSGQLKTQYELLCDCLTSINYTNLSNIYIALSTTSTQVTPAAGETILHKTFVNTSNFYKDGEAVNKIDVLKSILTSYNAFITQTGGDIYITDHNTLLAGTSITYKKYSISTFAYVSASAISVTGGTIQSYTESDFQFKIQDAYNSAVVRFNPNVKTKLIDYSTANDFSVTGATIVKNVGTYGWNYQLYTTSKDLILDKARIAKIIGTGSGNDSNSENVIIITGSTTGQTAFGFNVKYPYFICNTNKKHFLKLSLNSNFRTYTDYKNGSAVTEPLLKVGFLTVIIKIGNYYLNNNSVWTTTPSQIRLLYTNITDNSTTTIGDVWKTNVDNLVVDLKSNEIDGQYIPLFNTSGRGAVLYNLYGDLSITVLNKVEGLRYDYTTPVTIKDFQINKITLTLLDAGYNEISDYNIEKTGYFDSSYSDAYSDTELLLGDTQYFAPTEQGSLIFSGATSYQYFTGHTKNGINSTLQNLYLRSILNNYKTPTYSLTGTFINCINYNLLKYFTSSDTNFSGKKLVVNGLTLNINDNSTDISLIEMAADTETITEV